MNKFQFVLLIMQISENYWKDTPKARTVQVLISLYYAICFHNFEEILRTIHANVVNFTFQAIRIYVFKYFISS